MNTFWCHDTNRLIHADPCTSCGGYLWRFLSEETNGVWQAMGCFPSSPEKYDFQKIPPDPVIDTQPSSQEGDRK